jgi:hypothetical protein
VPHDHPLNPPPFIPPVTPTAHLTSQVLNDITADRGEREEGASRTVGLAEMCLGPGASETSPARKRLSKSRPSSRNSSRKSSLAGLEGQNEAQVAAVAHEAARLKALQAEADLAKK